MLRQLRDERRREARNGRLLPPPAKYIGAYTALMDGRLDAVVLLVVSVKMPRWFVNCLWANWGAGL